MIASVGLLERARTQRDLSKEDYCVWYLITLGIRIVRLGFLRYPSGRQGDACKCQCGRVASRGFGIFHFPFCIIQNG